MLVQKVHTCILHKTDLKTQSCFLSLTNAPPKSVEPRLVYSDSQLPPSYGYLYADQPYPENVSASFFKMGVGLRRRGMC